MNLRFGDWTEIKITVTLKPLKFTGFFFLNLYVHVLHTDSNFLHVTYSRVRNKDRRALLLFSGIATQHILGMTSHLGTNSKVRRVSLFTATR